MRKIWGRFGLRMKEEREALEEHYPWISPACLDFFGAHEYHDEGHGNMVVDVIKEHCMDEKLQEEMREAVKQRFLPSRISFRARYWATKCRGL
jgi:hypothetical protein